MRRIDFRRLPAPARFDDTSGQRARQLVITRTCTGRADAAAQVHGGAMGRRTAAETHP
ncbi:hypothetical protein [Brevibacterium luteolum]|uniref:hypothetical protein n=1 Tax=Brevibacterium luteolum TaxID=199591 RepID=UPI0014053194|nr:hypothetical protein [Brevibacterium luteolum]